ncbi:MAG TPA: iron-containing alcohol dehydrogenase [Syntrophales bacterium]|nr:iron-containing alcohol dehydrogenase [Syntrophales bacterium]HQB30383.1 iron-containing alcohol dehydrogenase [Syntrophales bacterium]HQN78637.1 iron-containing alcohol dehydrogenase [Syntrophales bacterium]HQQ28109.1 iron-containing alcohol dehydrogenase [Syntrophales bacterium]
MLPAYYQFYCPVKILSGDNALGYIPFEMTLLGVSRAMVVTDRGVAGAGLLSFLEAAFADSDRRIGHVFDEVPVDSSNRVANGLADLFRERKCDCFIAVGGGSAIDTAKGAAIVLSGETNDLLDLQGAERIRKDLTPLIVVPTTAGTGSEATRVAVIFNEENNVKMSFVSDKLYPRVAVLDPRMTLTMPPRITASTGMDALTHAVEAYLSVQKNPLSDAFALLAVDLVRRFLVRAAEDGRDREARFAMANAALFGGIAFSNSMVGVVHALAHAAGAVGHVPHGTANALLLPWGMEHNLGVSAKPMAELSFHLGGASGFLDPREQAESAISLVRNLLLKLNRVSGIPLRLRDAGVGEDLLPAIAQTAINDGTILYNPGEVTYEDALGILQKAF